MYERNAIVLERYFARKLGYQEKYNLRNNFYYYCELLDKIENYNERLSIETEASKIFAEVSNDLKQIAENQEKLYKRIARLEYNRNLLFSNIEEDPKELEKCMEKIEADVEKTQSSIVELRKNFINTVSNYQIKKKELEEAKVSKKDAEEEYKNCLELTKANFEGQSNAVLSYIKGITTDEIRRIKRELIDVITRNGAKEKIPFDSDVVSKASEFATEIAKKEADCYIIIFDKVKKLLEEIELNTLKLERHRKWRRDNTAKLNFFSAERNYLIQFLDNERLPVMHGPKVHRKLMIEACKNLLLDVSQMNNLYELILREEAGRSAKKAYKELYNKDYLRKIEEKEHQFEEEAANLKLSAVTLINSSYWRVEGIREVYTTFYSIITDLYGKDLEEFDVQPIEEVKSAQEIEDTIELELPQAKTLEQLDEIEDDIEDSNEKAEDEEKEILESFKSIENIDEEIDELDEELEDEDYEDDEIESLTENLDKEITEQIDALDEDIPYEDEDYEDELIEESLFEPILKARVQEQDLKAALAAVKDKQTKKKKSGILKNLIKINNKKKDTVE